MSEERKQEGISRRHMLSLLGLGAALGLAGATVLEASDADAQGQQASPTPATGGSTQAQGGQMQAHGGQQTQARQTGTHRRHARREARREHRHKRREARAEQRRKRREARTQRRHNRVGHAERRQKGHTGGTSTKSQ